MRILDFLSGEHTIDFPEKQAIIPANNKSGIKGDKMWTWKGTDRARGKPTNSVMKSKTVSIARKITGKAAWARGSRYLLRKARSPWTASQQERGAMLFRESHAPERLHPRHDGPGNLL